MARWLAPVPIKTDKEPSGTGSIPRTVSIKCYFFKRCHNLIVVDAFENVYCTNYYLKLKDSKATTKELKKHT